VLDLCLNGPEEKLAETQYCQPVMFIAGLAGVEVMRKSKAPEVENPLCVAGLSLGEYTALACAEVLSFEDALTLVKLRALAMQEAANLKPQAMCSVAGLDMKILDKLCAEAIEAQGGGKICQIANHLFPAGFTCAGDTDCIDKLCVLAKDARALQARVIKAGGAFHTPCMQPAQEKLEAAIDQVFSKMQPPKFHVYFNITGQKVARGTDPKQFVHLMKEQLTRPVLWEQTIKAMISDGCQEFYECGPNKQLTAMMKRIDANAFKRMAQMPV
jgi:[acyl-carrier-protein] S-malonyltransferase